MKYFILASMILLSACVKKELNVTIPVTTQVVVEKPGPYYGCTGWVITYDCKPRCSCQIYVDCKKTTQIFPFEFVSTLK